MPTVLRNTYEAHESFSKKGILLIIKVTLRCLLILSCKLCKLACINMKVFDQFKDYYYHC